MNAPGIIEGGGIVGKVVLELIANGTTRVLGILDGTVTAYLLTEIPPYAKATNDGARITK